MKLKNDDPQKWIMTEHTRIKHNLLIQYLSVWIPILSSKNKTLIYIDGFAGRGEYEDGSLGSPLIVMDLFQEVYNSGRVTLDTNFACIFVEENENNYSNLNELVEQYSKKCPAIKYAKCFNNDFDSYINVFLDNEKHLYPAFLLIDPFGFTGVKFKTVQRIMNRPRTEIFFNFMVRDINRFKGLEKQKNNMDVLFGYDVFHDFEKLNRSTNISNDLMALYRKRLYDTKTASYCLPFKVCEDDKCSPLYYMIYATNHFLGLKKMKEAMFKQSKYFSYLGPEEKNSEFWGRHIPLFSDEEIELKPYLLNKYLPGATKTFEEICEETYTDTRFLEPQYRSILKSLIKEGRIHKENVTSKHDSALSGNDKLTFL